MNRRRANFAHNSLLRWEIGGIGGRRQIGAIRLAFGTYMNGEDSGVGVSGQTLARRATGRYQDVQGCRARGV